MKFITSSVATVARRQKQGRRACEACRRKKRRCNHTLDFEINADAISDMSNFSVNSRLSPEREFTPGHGTNAQPQTQEAFSEANSRTPRRFIGDLSPESVFLSATRPETSTRGPSSQGSIGTWLVENLKTSRTSLESEGRNARQNGILANTSSTTEKLSSNFDEQCFSELPSESYLSQLLSFYAEEIHPVFPLIDIKSFQSDDLDRNSKILLSQAMCLLASTNPQCRGTLYLRGSNELLSPRLFGHRIFYAMRNIIEFGAVSNKMVQIQALGALALFTEGPEGSETSSQLCAKMIHLVHTIGLHIQRQDDHENEVTSLCCSWAIDRLNAAIHGRPVLMHERDIGRDLDKCFKSQRPAFRLLLLVISQLDQVIDLYRPQKISHPAVTNFNCPPFEDIVVSAQCANLPVRFLNTIEVLYFAIIILSCRDTEKSSNNRVQQLFAASRITSIVGQEIGNELVCLPFIPYAVSHALGIFYNQMRHTKVPTFRQRARWELQSTCDLLDRLSDYFSVASIMSKMGKATLEEMDRVSKSVLQEKNSSDYSQASQPLPYSDTNQLVASDAPESAAENGDMNPELSANNVAFSVPDVDVFDMFDPNFGLENIDAVFQSNLELCPPVYPSVYTGHMPRAI